MASKLICHIFWSLYEYAQEFFSLKVLSDLLLVFFTVEKPHPSTGSVLDNETVCWGDLKFKASSTLDPTPESSVDVFQCDRFGLYLCKCINACGH